MKGSGIDENKRAPMYWSSDPGTAGMTDGPPGMEDIEMKFGSFEEQDSDETSILNYYRKAIRIRNAFPAIAKGTTAVQNGSNDTICVFTRQAENETPVMIVINTGESEAEVNLNDTGTDFRTLAADLTVNETSVTLEGDVLKMPGRAIAVLINQ